MQPETKPAEPPTSADTFSLEDDTPLAPACPYSRDGTDEPCESCQ